MNNKECRPTSYIVVIWNEDGTEKIKEEIYPMHQYSLDDVFALLKGKEKFCDIYKGRYWKERGKYITTRGDVLVWDGFQWTVLP